MALRSVASWRPVTTVAPFHLNSRQQQPLSSRFVARAVEMETFHKVLENNKTWVAEKVKEQADYFSRYAEGQAPPFLWIGCSDSRVVGNDIMGLDPGDVFTHRNVGNIVSPCDLNCMSCLDYGIGALKVKHVVLCGHYGCGAVKAAMTLPLETPGCVNCWLAPIREVQNKYSDILNALPEGPRYDLLCELNALEQTVAACASYPVQSAWKSGQDLTVNCVLYDIRTGELKVLMEGIRSLPSMMDLEFLNGHVKPNGVKPVFNASVKQRIAAEV